MNQASANRVIWGLVAVFVMLALAAFVLDWGSAVVRILGVLVVVLVLYQVLKRRGGAAG
ncbi:MAG TPA: hypothetical protein VFM49_14560 [Chloroflexia bacterium]|nr:hypothetical protein [Chloroflexia bacterium]